MKRPILIAITILVAVFAALIFWLVPAKTLSDNEGWTRGNSFGFITLPTDMVGDAMISTLEQHGFMRVEERTFDKIVPHEPSGRSYVGFIALRDTTAQQPNKFFLGVGPSDTIFYYESHEGSIKEAAAWKNHVNKQIRNVEKLTSNPR